MAETVTRFLGADVAAISLRMKEIIAMTSESSRGEARRGEARRGEARRGESGGQPAFFIRPPEFCERDGARGASRARKNVVSQQFSHARASCVARHSQQQPARGPRAPRDMGAVVGGTYRLAAARRGPAACSSGRFAKLFGTASGTMASSSSKTAAMCVIGDEVTKTGGKLADEHPAALTVALLSRVPSDTLRQDPGHEHQHAGQAVVFAGGTDSSLRAERARKAYLNRRHPISVFSVRYLSATYDLVFTSGGIGEEGVG
ncbi:MAG: hypothetical protein BJ554DRAFT_3685 [Olpidium bornovanus]|uniref:Uncharacterized protein n=1 Tax=Olpidium bornovanus TaxID=278681 RepID=A0A8H8DFD2_9FUNG|nr:MAG: hypothetical protein BJ554DRAFT_3685 [Olpidium bornovanus]